MERLKEYKSIFEKIKQEENLKDSFEQCLRYLFLEIRYIKPSLILSFGEPPFQMLCEFFDWLQKDSSKKIAWVDWLQDYSFYDYWNEKKKIDPHTLRTKKITDVHGSVCEFGENNHWIIFMHPSNANQNYPHVKTIIRNQRIQDIFGTYEKSISGIIQEITRTNLPEKP